MHPKGVRVHREATGRQPREGTGTFPASPLSAAPPSLCSPSPWPSAGFSLPLAKGSSALRGRVPDPDAALGEEESDCFRLELMEAGPQRRVASASPGNQRGRPLPGSGEMLQMNVTGRKQLEAIIRKYTELLLLSRNKLQTRASPTRMYGRVPRIRVKRSGVGRA